MRKRKVDPIILEKFLRVDGLSQKEAAERFEVSEGTISKNVKLLTFASAKDVFSRSASKIADKKLSAMGRLERIARGIEDELSYVEKTMKKASGEERREWEENHIKYNAEVRKQVALLREIALTLYNVEEISAFKQIILEEIGREDEEVRKRILERIRSRRTDSGLSGFSGLGI